MAGTEQREGLGVPMGRRAGGGQGRAGESPSLPRWGVCQHLQEIPGLGQYLRRFLGAEAQIHPGGQ